VLARLLASALRCARRGRLEVAFGSQMPRLYSRP
jgi:hypothetical protein